MKRVIKSTRVSQSKNTQKCWLPLTRKCSLDFHVPLILLCLLTKGLSFYRPNTYIYFKYFFFHFFLDGAMFCVKGVTPGHFNLLLQNTFLRNLKAWAVYLHSSGYIGLADKAGNYRACRWRWPVTTFHHHPPHTHTKIHHVSSRQRDGKRGTGSKPAAQRRTDLQVWTGLNIKLNYN